MDLNLTRKQYEDGMNKWAKENGVEEQYANYTKQQEEEKNELEEGLKQISRYFRKNRELENNTSITYAQAEENRQKFLAKLTPKQKVAKQFLECLFTPTSAKDCFRPMGPFPVPGPVVPGPTGPETEVPGPTGPGPVIPVPTGPGPYGPGPMNPYGPGIMNPYGPGTMYPYGPVPTNPYAPFLPRCT
ncbi:hypothetical protein NECAME_09009 [Necator americanus]|uniref:SXP/RAL-2 family protein Ani s 5-like cation-binding domain-containing protein n=1 Tax=Necator americanus TaxID=51031 RepID=W2TI32_NECAM|nr:hypothetical protein NECAME_09009 [Necator americanus]ETN80687.1 hypothetical protein NECAME_09009 [Necator americanus]